MTMETPTDQPMPQESLPPPIDHEHSDVTAGWLRPAVFGAMDGLVSNAALIAGVAGGTRDHSDASVVILAGLAGLAAGAFSMAAGEYVSVASQSEAAEREIAKERKEIMENPAAEIAELAEMYVEKGIEPELAREVALQVHRDVENAVNVHSIEELGVDPKELASPSLAAVSSFLAFAVGALIPVLPYLFGTESIVPTLVVSLLALFGCGAVVTRVTSKHWAYGGARQVVVGAAAFGVTYVVGMGVGAGIT
jgi:VIT1/CCC1 family predicted Fe2+/Mn2+ transporter